jgi:hypothetical protein
VLCACVQWGKRKDAPNGSPGRWWSTGSPYWQVKSERRRRAGTRTSKSYQRLQWHGHLISASHYYFLPLKIKS